MKKFNYELELEVFRNSKLKYLGVLRGSFSGFGCPKRHPDTLLAKTMDSRASQWAIWYLVCGYQSMFSSSKEEGLTIASMVSLGLVPMLTGTYPETWYPVGLSLIPPVSMNRQKKLIDIEEGPRYRFICNLGKSTLFLWKYNLNSIIFPPQPFASIPCACVGGHKVNPQFHAASQW